MFAGDYEPCFRFYIITKLLRTPSTFLSFEFDFWKFYRKKFVYNARYTETIQQNKIGWVAPSRNYRFPTRNQNVSTGMNTRGGGEEWLLNWRWPNPFCTVWYAGNKDVFKEFAHSISPCIGSSKTGWDAIVMGHNTRNMVSCRFY